MSCAARDPPLPALPVAHEAAATPDLLIAALVRVRARVRVLSSIFGDTVNTASRMASTAPPALDSPDASNPAFYIHLHSSAADQVRQGASS